MFVIWYLIIRTRPIVVIIKIQCSETLSLSYHRKLVSRPHNLESNVAKGEIARKEQFLPSHCFLFRYFIIPLISIIRFIVLSRFFEVVCSCDGESGRAHDNSGSGQRSVFVIWAML